MSEEVETLKRALVGLEKIHKVVNKSKQIEKPPENPPERKMGPLFKGESYERQKRGEKYWFDDTRKRTTSQKPMGVVGNIHGITDVL